MAILGIDEVGRGPLAGPLVVGAVVLPEEKNSLPWVAELKDSKKLSPKKREKLSEIILSEAPVWGMGWVSPSEIDALGMGAALKLATRRAVEAVQKMARTKPVKITEIIIDGTTDFLSGTPLARYTTTLIKGDDKIKEISAASIIAKVARDKYMMEKAQKYPGYGWEKNMGYGTKQHREAIMKKGVTMEHRLSFEPCKSLVGFQPAGNRGQKNTTMVGKKGEKIVGEYLEARGHKIVSYNFKTRECEIDIISVFDGEIFFTEVKTRKDGSGLAAISKQKIKRMEFAVEVFLKFHSEYSQYNPLLAAASVDGNFRVKDWLKLSW